MGATTEGTRYPPEVFSDASMSPSVDAAKEAIMYKESGNALYVRKAYDDAIERYTRSVNLDCTKPSLFTNRAAARFALFNATGDTTHLLTALQDAERSIAIDQRCVKGYYRKGVCLSSLNAPTDAAVAFQEGLKIDPKNEQMNSALSKVEHQIANTPKDWEDAKTRGNTSYGNGHYEDAVRWYTAGLEMLGVRNDSVGVNSHGGDGTVSAEKNDASTNIATLLANRAEVRRQMSDVKACVADCDLALLHVPKHLKATIRRALAYEYLERFEDSVADFKSAWAIDPGNALATEGIRRVSAFAKKNVE